ncbi:MAG TPA: FecR domain-containing protein [Microvirga sp.]|jgi:hypothetical protein|nr:FecR domain-containing protein [Microvirga sp.]
MTIPDEATFTTSRNSRARLERNNESIVVSPGTVLSPDTSIFGWTTIQQQSGRILLDVEKRNVPHFAVETPYLAAVVKGTQFTVSVGQRRADVHVGRGLVGVTEFRSGQSADVAPGQTASALASRTGLQVGGIGKAPEVQQGQARAAQVTSVTAEVSRAKAAQSAASAKGNRSASANSNGKSASSKRHGDSTGPSGGTGNSGHGKGGGQASGKGADSKEGGTGSEGRGGSGKSGGNAGDSGQGSGGGGKGGDRGGHDSGGGSGGSRGGKGNDSGKGGRGHD